MNEEQLKLLSRLKRDSDGKAFVEEILQPLFRQNHIDILTCNREVRTEVIGFGLCLQHLVTLFDDCDIRLASIKDLEEEITSSLSIQ